jgi:hypothetical protein
MRRMHGVGRGFVLSWRFLYMAFNTRMKMCVVGHTYNSSTLGAEAGRSQVPD